MQAASDRGPWIAARNRKRSDGRWLSRSPDGDDVLAHYDDNRNGQITRKGARRHAIAPVHRSHPACAYMRDGGGDGVAYE